MAHKRSGAGKTYTLSSIQPDALGMIARAAAEVFAHIAADVLNEYTVFMSYIQIYMEMIQLHIVLCKNVLPCTVPRCMDRQGTLLQVC